MLLALLCVAMTGMGFQVYRGLQAGLVQSPVLDELRAEVGNSAPPVEPDQGQNILLMGLDSRLDQRGRALPQEMYDALHAGDESVGGYNTNVLMLIHIPSNGGKAVVIQIPRDDYVDWPDGRKGKIKQVYGESRAAAMDSLVNKGLKGIQLEQAARDAGRKAQIAVVQKFLGGVHIDHFLEVTLAAFLEMARAVEPLDVCLNQKTADTYSGADFHPGINSLNASQMVAFVRQRRDLSSSLQFTDLDRERRQQAFIISLMHKLQESGTLTDFGKMEEIFNAAKENIAVDANPDLELLMRTLSRLSAGNMSMYTLPVERFAMINEESVNVVDVPTIRRTVARLLAGQPLDAKATTPAEVPVGPARQSDGTFPAANGVATDVVNANGGDGLAGNVMEQLAAKGFTRGAASNADLVIATTIEYSPGTQQAAEVAQTIIPNSSIKEDSTLAGKMIRVTLGTSHDPASANSPTLTPISGEGTGKDSPAPTDLTQLDSGAIPCVK